MNDKDRSGRLLVDASDFESPINRKKNRYLPMLVLGNKINKSYKDDNKYEIFNMKSSEDWFLIKHVSAGHAHNYNYIQCRELQPTKLGSELIKRVVYEYKDSSVGVFGVPLDEINRYNNILNEYNLSCNNTYNNFEESIYPIDICEKAFEILTTDVLPEDLDDFIEFNDDDRKSSMHRMLGMIGRWQLYILA